MRNIKKKREQVKEYADLTKVYGNGKVQCPWHDDVNPSCHIYPNGAYCFSCGESGDQIQFVEDYEGIGHTEAIELLLDYLQGSPVENSKDGTPVKTDIVDDLVASLWKPQEEVFKYLLIDRKLDADLLAHLHIGWSPERKSVAIPYIYHGEARNIKFRVLPKYRLKRQPKYQGMDNKPFRWLYPVDYVRKTYPDADTLFVTEGEFDAMALLSKGFPAMSLPNGASTNVNKHLRTLKLYDKVYFLYDMDEAGQKSAQILCNARDITGETVIESAEPTEIKVIVWNEEWGKDVTEALELLVVVLGEFYDKKEV